MLIVIRIVGDRDNVPQFPRWANDSGSWLLYLRFAPCFCFESKRLRLPPSLICFPILNRRWTSAWRTRTLTRNPSLRKSWSLIWPTVPRKLLLWLVWSRRLISWKARLGEKEAIYHFVRRSLADSSPTNMYRMHSSPLQIAVLLLRPRSSSQLGY